MSSDKTTSQLETANNPEDLERIVINPLTRVEGHGKVTLLQDENLNIKQARLHISEFRGFEKFIQGRPYWELPVLVQRLCGICPVSHHLAAAKATDMIVGATELTAYCREDQTSHASWSDTAITCSAFLSPVFA